MKKKEHPNEQYFCKNCGAENYGFAYWCIKCGAFPPTQNFSSVKGYKMKTYIVIYTINHNSVIHIVNAENKKEASTAALYAGIQRDHKVFEIDTKTKGVVFSK